ncbi:MAG: DEAD/DEAH box helicase family protein [Blastocatellia bacterium]
MDKLLRFDQGTIVLEGFSKLPVEVESYFYYDARVDAYRASSHHYFEVINKIKHLIKTNKAAKYRKLQLATSLPLTPYPHQQEAIKNWKANKGRGLIVLPTGAGKSLVGVLAILWASRTSLVVVPTLDLMHQWFALLKANFPDVEIGLIGGGYYEVKDLSVATYDSAARHMERFGNLFGMLVLDEVHHLPTEFYKNIAEFSLAPYRLGLTATPERLDLRHQDLPALIGPLVYRREAIELAGDILAPFQIRRLYVELSGAERQAYQAALELRDNFLRLNNISLRSLIGWQHFVMMSARTMIGRQAMRAHREARRLAQAAPAKLRTLEVILLQHQEEKTVIFTEDNATAYEISKTFLIPCITHQTRVKERQHILTSFRSGSYKTLVTSKVLNEGVDVPDAAIGVILSGSSVNREFVQRLGRILRKSEGKQAVLYEIVTRNTQEERVSQRRREGVLLNTDEQLKTDKEQNNTLPLFDSGDSKDNSPDEEGF